MPPSSFFLYFFALAFRLLLPSSAASLSQEFNNLPPDDGILIAQHDLQALLAIKQSFLDPFHSLRSWNSSHGACSGLWIGVKCAQGQVIVLQLPNKGLAGYLSPLIGNLFSLRRLNLHSNSIRGAIPASLSLLPKLRALYLHRNQFSGSIPPGLANSPSLLSLDLSHNSLSGSIPSLISRFNSSSSSKLSFVDFSYNNLSAQLNSSSFAGLHSLLELHISHSSLLGPFPSDLLQRLPSLSLLDLSYNDLNGSFRMSPSYSILILNISFNAIAGALPAEIGNSTRLQFFDASHNGFSSFIPAELGNITGLQSLDLSFNQFNGSIPLPLAELKNLTAFNCSFNRLTGKVPSFAHGFSASAFEGNAGLCGYDSSVACAFEAPSPSSPTVSSSPSRSGDRFPTTNGAAGHHHRSGMSTVLIITLCSAATGMVLVCMIMAFVCIFWCRRTAKRMADGKAASAYGSSEEDGMGSQTQKGAANFAAVAADGGGSKDSGSGEVGGGKLVHFDGAMVKFTADRLLCATAEVLGKSTYGTVYKATFEDSSEVAVKRLREGIVKSQRDFEMEVNLLGKIRHPNLLSLRGYYWGPKNEKLLIYDFMAGGSLAAFLHARGPETPLTWHTRLNIAAGTARGLSHLHNAERIIHGNLTSSNVLLDARMNAKISDFGLSRLMTASANANVVATASALGYRAPELTKLRKATTKTDVYSFGVILLELLTGKSPAESSSGDQTAGMDLPEWVASIVKEEWTNEIFDLELMKGCAPSEDELINTLQLAMNCVTPSPSSRPSMEEVCQLLEETLNRPEQQRGRQQQCQTTSSDSSAV